jgi:hypothetical protein
MNQTQTQFKQIEWGMIEVKSGMRNIQEAIYLLVQDNNFHFTQEDKKQLDDFIKAQQDNLAILKSYTITLK